MTTTDIDYLSREEQVDSLRNAAAVFDALLRANVPRLTLALRADIMEARDICRATADAFERSRKHVSVKRQACGPDLTTAAPARPDWTCRGCGRRNSGDRTNCEHCCKSRPADKRRGIGGVR
jgi:hypothetical protein